MSMSNQDARWQLFVECGGFKLLSVAGLSGHALSIVCYLINCYFSKITELLTSSKELSVLLGMTVSEVELCLKSLTDMNIVRQDRNNGERMLLSVNLDPQTWKNLLLPENRDSGLRRRIGDAANILRMHPQDTRPLLDVSEPLNSSAMRALNFPLQVVRSEAQSTTSLDEAGAQRPISLSDEMSSEGKSEHLSDADIVSQFLAAHPDCQFERESFFFETLIRTHPREQVLRMIDTFGIELRSLGMLVGAWVHYSQKLEQVAAEEQAASIEEYRRQAEKNDEMLRRAARRFLIKAGQEELSLGADERVLLNVFEEHDHPRKQLFWALKIRARYTNLGQFFKECEHLAESPGVPRLRKTPRPQSE